MKISNLRMMLASTILAGAVMSPVAMWAAGYQKQGRSITLSLPTKQQKEAKTTIEDGVIICWRHIVAKDFTALVNTVDVPSLRVVSAHAIIIEKGLPLGEVVIGEVK